MKKKQENNPCSLDHDERKTIIQRRTNTKNREVRDQAENKNNRKPDHVDSAMHRTGAQYTNAKHWS